MEMTASLLPRELILEVAAHLESSILLPIWSINPSSNSSFSRSKNSSCFDPSLANSLTNPRTSDRSTLLSLSSISHRFRIMLSPFIWNQISITNPNQMGRLRRLMSFYNQISGPDPNVDPTDSSEQRLPFPLHLIQHLEIDLDDRFQSFPQDILCEMLRNGMNHNLKSLSWNSEALPNPALWLALENQSSRVDDQGCRSEDLPTEEKNGGSKGLKSLEVNCKIFWTGHPNLSRLRSLQHLKLTSFDSQLLPIHLPLLLSNLSMPLLSLSLSTSKTSLLHVLSPSMLELRVNAHQRPLINSSNVLPALLDQTNEGRGPFSNLIELDIFPVTPESPLDESLIQSGKTLKHLRICLDVSGAFGNYDRLWQSLTNRMEALESLDVEPYPQQNTAPSFQSFVESCPKLTLINGRRIDQLPPCLTPFDPDNRTSALAY